MNKKLTPRQRRFVVEYGIDLNATRAAVRAGYKKNNPDVVGPRLLEHAGIKEAIAEMERRKFEKLGLNAQKILSAIARKAFSNIFDYVRIEEGELIPDFSTMTRDQAEAIQEFSVDSTGGTGDGERKVYLRTKFKMADQLRALELLGRHLKLFTDKTEHSVDANLAAILLEREESIR